MPSEQVLILGMAKLSQAWIPLERVTRAIAIRTLLPLFALAFSASPTMATSPLQIDATKMAGEWILSVPAIGASCAVSLSAAGEGPMRPVTAPDDCLDRLGLGDIAAWWPDTDGIGLAARDGALQVFLATQSKDQFEGRTKGAVLVRMARP
jgi:hypothetical protein